MGSLNILVIINNFAVHMGVQILLQDPDLIFTGYICRYGIAESYGSSTLKFWKNHHIVSHSNCTNSHSHQHCTKFAFLYFHSNTHYHLFDGSHSNI